jgi:hypothetical protein
VENLIFGITLYVMLYSVLYYVSLMALIGFLIYLGKKYNLLQKIKGIYETFNEKIKI